MNKIINKTDINLSEFFNENFFVKLLCKTLSTNQHFHIENIVLSRGSNDGENYFSKILRIDMTYNEKRILKKLSFIMKYLPSDEKRPFGENLNFFLKEIDMADKIIPQLETILSNQIILAPRHIYLNTDPERIIVFEDLKAFNYKLADRQIGIDEKHARLVLKKIAKFHAASMKLAQQNPESMKYYDKGFFHENNRSTTLQKNIFEGNLDCIADAVEEWPGFDRISKKLRKLKNDHFERCLAEEKINENDLNVLNHGDLHLNNFMFKYDSSGEVEDVIFLDFQMCHYSSVGIDLNYFLNTSLQIDVLIKNRDELLRYYYENLFETLSDISFTYLPSLNDVLDAVRSKEFYGFFAFEAILPTISMHPDYCSKANVDKFSSEEILTRRRKVMFSTQRYIATMKYSLKRFDELGVLE